MPKMAEAALKTIVLVQTLLRVYSDRANVSAGPLPTGHGLVSWLGSCANFGLVCASMAPILGNRPTGVAAIE